MPSYRPTLILCALLTACTPEPEATTDAPTPSPAPAPAPVATPTPKPTPAPTPTTRERVRTEASSLVGLRETHGRNRSPLIDSMNRLTGAPMGSPWCASFNAYIYNRAEVPPPWPRSAWSPDWVQSPTWTRGKGGQTPLPGDAFGIWFSNKGRVAHTGLIEKWGEAVVTIEGNTGPTGSVGEADRNGDGSYRKRRLPRQIHSVRDWISA
jgi:hypothetical protein